MSANPAINWWVSFPRQLWLRWVLGYQPSRSNWPLPLDFNRLGLPDGVPLPARVPLGFALGFYRRDRLPLRTTIGGEFFRYKYRGDLDAGWRLVCALDGFIQAKRLAVDVVVPVPSSPIFREFSPSLWLGRQLGLRINKPVYENVFLRTRPGLPQKTVVTSVAKRTNVTGMYLLNDSRRKALRGKNILLLDDMCDTGSTLAELCGILSGARITSVIPLTCARTGEAGGKGRRR